MLTPTQQELLRAYRAEQARYEGLTVESRVYLSQATLSELVGALQMIDLTGRMMPAAVRAMLTVGILELITTMIPRLEAGEL